MKKEVNEIEATAEEVKPTVKQKKSVSYALKAIGPHLDVIAEGGYISTEVWTTFKNRIREAKERYIKEQYGL